MNCRQELSTSCPPNPHNWPTLDNTNNRRKNTKCRRILDGAALGNTGRRGPYRFPPSAPFDSPTARLRRAVARSWQATRESNGALSERSASRGFLIVRRPPHSFQRCFYCGDDAIVVSMPWVYILCCSDGTFYVGHTDDLENREARHNSGVAAKYTAIRRPSDSCTQKRTRLTRPRSRASVS